MGGGGAGDTDVAQQAVVEFPEPATLAGAIVPGQDNGEQADRMIGKNLERTPVSGQGRKPLLEFIVPQVAGCKWVVITSSPLGWYRRGMAARSGCLTG